MRGPKLTSLPIAMIAFGLFDVYVAAAIIGAGYVVIGTLLGHLDLGGGHEAGVGHGHAHVDLGHDADLGHELSSEVAGAGHDAAHPEATGAGHEAADAGAAHFFGPTSPLIIALFLTCFGLTGILFTRSWNLQAWSLVPASGSSFVFAAAGLWLLNKIFGAAAGSSHASWHERIGLRAETTTPISKRGVGEIVYVLRGSRCTGMAKSGTGLVIPKGKPVLITGVRGEMNFVVPIETDRAKRKG